MILLLSIWSLFLLRDQHQNNEEYCHLGCCPSHLLMHASFLWEYLLHNFQSFWKGPGRFYHHLFLNHHLHQKLTMDLSFVLINFLELTNLVVLEILGLNFLAVLVLINQNRLGSWPHCSGSSLSIYHLVRPQLSNPCYHQFLGVVEVQIPHLSRTCLFLAWNYSHLIDQTMNFWYFHLPVQVQRIASVFYPFHYHQ